MFLKKTIFFAGYCEHLQPFFNLGCFFSGGSCSHTFLQRYWVNFITLVAFIQSFKDCSPIVKQQLQICIPSHFRTFQNSDYSNKILEFPTISPWLQVYIYWNTICFIWQHQLQASFFNYATFKNSRPQVLLGKGVLKICSKFTGEHQCGSVISIKLQKLL